MKTITTFKELNKLPINSVVKVNITDKVTNNRVEGDIEVCIFDYLYNVCNNCVFKDFSSKCLEGCKSKEVMFKYLGNKKNKSNN